jgi:hypothetical protein
MQVDPPSPNGAAVAPTTTSPLAETAPPTLLESVGAIFAATVGTIAAMTAVPVLRALHLGSKFRTALLRRPLLRPKVMVHRSEDAAAKLRWSILCTSEHQYLVVLGPKVRSVCVVASPAQLFVLPLTSVLPVVHPSLSSRSSPLAGRRCVSAFGASQSASHLPPSLLPPLDLPPPLTLPPALSLPPPLRQAGASQRRNGRHVGCRVCGRGAGGLARRDHPRSHQRRPRLRRHAPPRHERARALCGH